MDGREHHPEFVIVILTFIMLEDQPAVTTDEYVRTRVGF